MRVYSLTPRHVGALQLGNPYRGSCTVLDGGNKNNGSFSVNLNLFCISKYPKI